VLGIGVEKDDSALLSNRLGPAVVHVGGGMKTNARMIVVIPVEKSGTVGLGVLEAAEAIREIGSVLEGPELRFTERIVITWGRLSDLVTPRSTRFDPGRLFLENPP
jgi:hypothetical protein